MKRKKKSARSTVRIRDESLQNPFLEERETRFAVTKSGRLFVILAVLLIALMFAAVMLRYDFVHKPVSAARYLDTVTTRFGELWRLTTGGGSVNGMSFSLCTIAIVAIVGGSLAVSGSVFQGVFHTPMASPSMLGIQSGGMVAAVLYLFLFWDSSAVMEYYTHEEYTTYLDSLSFTQIYAQQIWIIVGSFIGAAIVIFISTRAGRGKLSTVVLILSGSLFGSFAHMAVSLGQYYFTYVDSTTNRVYALMSISMGTFANTYSLTQLIMIAVPVIICMVAIFALAPGLNTLMFGDEEARSMGMNVKRFRNLMLILCVIPCAVILSFCGQISFVGLIVPHFSRQIAGSNYRRQLPASALLGAITMVLVYTAALCTGYTTSINLVTSVVGGVLFTIFLLKYRRQRNADWA